MANVYTPPTIHEESALTPATREALGAVVLDAVVGDDNARSALVGEMNAVLEGSGLTVVDIEATQTPEAEKSEAKDTVTSEEPDVEADFTTGLFTMAGAIRKFWSLPPQTRANLRQRSHDEGYNGLIVDNTGKPLFQVATKRLGVY